MWLRSQRELKAKTSGSPVGFDRWGKSGVVGNLGERIAWSYSGVNVL